MRTWWFQISPAGAVNVCRLYRMFRTSRCHPTGCVRCYLQHHQAQVDQARGFRKPAEHHRVRRNTSAEHNRERKPPCRVSRIPRRRGLPAFAQGRLMSHSRVDLPRESAPTSIVVEPSAQRRPGSWHVAQERRATVVRPPTDTRTAVPSRWVPEGLEPGQLDTRTRSWSPRHCWTCHHPRPPSFRNRRTQRRLLPGCRHSSCCRPSSRCRCHTRIGNSRPSCLRCSSSPSRSFRRCLGRHRRKSNRR